MGGSSEGVAFAWDFARPPGFPRAAFAWVHGRMCCLAVVLSAVFPVRRGDTPALPSSLNDRFGAIFAIFAICYTWQGVRVPTTSKGRRPGPPPEPSKGSPYTPSKGSRTDRVRGRPSLISSVFVLFVCFCFVLFVCLFVFVLFVCLFWFVFVALFGFTVRPHL